MVVRRGASKFGCLVWLLVIAAVLYFGIPVAETYMRYQEYRDAMRQEVRFRANLSNEKIRAHLRLVADSLGLPEEAGEVEVTREGNRITVEAEYEEPVNLVGIRKKITYKPRASDTY